MKIGIGNDHSALELKAEIKKFLEEKGHEVVDYGTNSTESCDYPIYGEKVAPRCGSRRSGAGNSDLRNRAWHFTCGQQGKRNPCRCLQ